MVDFYLKPFRIIDSTGFTVRLLYFAPGFLLSEKIIVSF